MSEQPPDPTRWLADLMGVRSRHVYWLDLRQLTDVFCCNLQKDVSCNRHWRLAACAQPYTRTHDPGSRGSGVPAASHRGRALARRCPRYRGLLAAH